MYNYFSKSVYLLMRIFVLILFSLIAMAQPGDPSGDPDSVITAFPKENVFDSLATVKSKGKEYLVLYHRNKPVIIYRKERKAKKVRGVQFH